MESAMLSIILSFIEGLALIASPCILPILPIVMAGSLSGSKKRPLGIIVGFILFFSIFTFFSRALLRLSGIDSNLIRHVSYFILILLGVMMMSTYLTDKFNILTQRLLNVGSSFSTANDAQGGFMSGVLFGGLVAIIWTPCAGPILAAVIVQTVLQQTTIMSFLTLLAFSAGVALPLFLIALFGRAILAKLGFIKQHTVLLRKLLGLIIVVSVAYIVNLEYSFAGLGTKTSSVSSSELLVNGLTQPYPAPEIGGITQWFNSPPLQINDLKGKVVLIDFWTYSCINCLRTLPYIKGWYDKYHDKGLVIIGVHTPEFEFEKNPENVKNAIAKLGIKYPVALDNDFVTWRNFYNQYWPAHYLIDKNGMVVYTHFGEGEYDVTENNIRFLLGMGKKTETTSEAAPVSYGQTPETYFGYERARNFSSTQGVTADHPAVYAAPAKLDVHEWALIGKWTVRPDKIISQGGEASLTIRFRARNVYVVMGSSGKPIPVKVKLTDVQSAYGKDVVNETITVSGSRLYEVVALPSVEVGTLTLTTTEPGLELYTFTFGS